MPICVQVNPDNSLTALPSNVDCTTGYVLVSKTEFEQLNSAPWHMSSDQASEIGFAILTVWALAFSIRLIRNLLLERETQDE